MPSPHASLISWTRGGLAVLCILLAASVTMRISVYLYQSGGGGAVTWEPNSGPVDLGEGTLLPRADAVHRTVMVGTCLAPASINFVGAGFYASDPSLVGAPGPEDRVFYIYRGWRLGRRFVSVRLNAIYFVHRVYARLVMHKNLATDDLAVKVIVPASCDASLNDVMAALRWDVRS